MSFWQRPTWREMGTSGGTWRDICPAMSRREPCFRVWRRDTEPQIKVRRRDAEPQIKVRRRRGMAGHLSCHVPPCPAGSHHRGHLFDFKPESLKSRAEAIRHFPHHSRPFRVCTGALRWRSLPWCSGGGGGRSLWSKMVPPVQIFLKVHVLARRLATTSNYQSRSLVFDKSWAF